MSQRRYQHGTVGGQLLYKLLFVEKLGGMLLVFLVQLFQHTENMHRLINNYHSIRSAIFKDIGIIAEAFIHLQRSDFDTVESLQTALGVNIKAAHSVKLIVEPFYAYRRTAVNRVHVQNITAQAELSQSINLLRTLIAQIKQRGSYITLFVLLADSELQRLAGHTARTQLLLLQRLCCNENNATLLTAQKAQCCRTSGLQLQALRICLHTWQAYRIKLLHRQIGVQIIKLAAIGTDFLTRSSNKGHTALAAQQLICGSKKDRLAASSQPG